MPTPDRLTVPQLRRLRRFLIKEGELGWEFFEIVGACASQGRPAGFQEIVDKLSATPMVHGNSTEPANHLSSWRSLVHRINRKIRSAYDCGELAADGELCPVFISKRGKAYILLSGAEAEKKLSSKKPVRKARSIATDDESKAPRGVPSISLASDVREIDEYVAQLRSWLESRIVTFQTRCVSRLDLPRDDETDHGELIGAAGLLSRSSRSMLFGGPGLGKTTFIDELALHAIGQGMIPVYVDLHGLSPDLTELCNHVISQARRYKSSNMGFDLPSRVTRPLLLLFDHLDKAFGVDRALAAINGYMAQPDQRTSCLVVIAQDRIDTVQVPIPGCQRWALEPLTVQQVESFLVDGGSSELSEVEADIARTPIWIDVISRVRAAGSADADRYALLEAYQQERLSSIEIATRSVGGVAWKTQALGSLALSMRSSVTDGLMGQSECLSHLHASIVVAAGEDGVVLTPMRLKDIVDDVVRSGLVQLTPDRRFYRFEHEVFEQFYLACHLVTDPDGRDLIIDLANHPDEIFDHTWQQAMRLWAARETNVEQVIVELALASDDAFFHCNLVLAINLLTVCHVDENKIVQISACIDAAIQVASSLRHKELLESFRTHLSDSEDTIGLGITRVNNDPHEEDRAIGIDVPAIDPHKEVLDLAKACNAANASTRLRAVESMPTDCESGIEALLRLAVDEDIQVAMRALSRLEADAAIKKIADKLVNSLDHCSLHVAGLAAEIIGRSGSHSACQALVDHIIATDDQEKRRSLAWTLRPPASFEVVRTLLKDKRVRKSALVACGYYPAPQAVDALISEIPSDDADWQYLVIEKLATVGGQDSTVALHELMTDGLVLPSPDTLHALASAAGFDECLNALESFLRHPDPIVRAATLDATWAYSECPDTDRIIPALGDESLQVRRAAASALRNRESPLLDEEFQEKLRQAGQENPKLWLSAALFGLRVPTEDDRDDLQKFLHSEDPEIRISALDAIDYIVNSEVVRELIEMLNDFDPDVRHRVMYVLGNSGSQAAVRALVNLIDSSDESDRKTLSSALNIPGSEIAESALISLVQDSNLDVRMNAMQSLSRLQTARSIDVLIGESKSTDSRQAGRAGDWLTWAQNLGSERARMAVIGLIRRDFDEWANAVTSARGPEALSPMIDLYRTIEDQEAQEFILEHIERLCQEYHVKVTHKELGNPG